MESGCTDYLQHSAESCPVLSAAHSQNVLKSLNTIMCEGVRDGWIEDDRTTAAHAPGAPQEDRLVLKDSRRRKVACFQLVNERTGVVYADIYSDGLAEMIADHNYKVSS